MTLKPYQMEERTTLKAVGECLAVIKELHPNWKFDAQLTPKLWHDALKYYPVNIVKRSVLDVAQKSKYTPKLADILEEIKSNDNLPPIYLENQEFNMYKKADEWWHNLSKDERAEVIHRTNKYVEGEEISLSEYELIRAQLIIETIELIEELNI